MHLGHSHDCRALLSRPPIHRQANLAFFRGERDLLGQGRGLVGDVLSCASRGAWCNLRVHSEVTRRDPLHTVMGCVIRRFSVSHIAILGGRLGEPGAERERVPDQVRSIRARPNGLVTRDHDASSQPAEAEFRVQSLL